MCVTRRILGPRRFASRTWSSPTLLELLRTDASSSLPPPASLLARRESANFASLDVAAPRAAGISWGDASLRDSHRRSRPMECQKQLPVLSRNYGSVKIVEKMPFLRFFVK